MQDQEFAHHMLKGSAAAGLVVASLFAVVTIASSGTSILTSIAGIGATQPAAIAAGAFYSPNPPEQWAPQGQNAPQLTPAQLQAVVQLLQSDNVSSNSIANIEALLSAPTPSGIPNTPSASSTPPSGVPNTPSTPCLSLSMNLYPGATDANTGGEVTQLQSYLGVSLTGYFGQQTEQAVQNWQFQQGIVASGAPQTTGFGGVGPRTRAKMRCQIYHIYAHPMASSSASTTSFSANPASGPAPLTVQFTATAPQDTALGSTVNFGDGTSGSLVLAPTCSSCSELGTVSHTYQSAGTYIAQLAATSAGSNAYSVIAQTTVTVTVAGTSTPSNIQQLNAPGSVELSAGGIAEIMNESFYFTLQSLTNSTATIQITPVGCWNYFPSESPASTTCELEPVPIPPQTLSIGQIYASTNYSITLTGIASGEATFSIIITPTTDTASSTSSSGTSSTGSGGTGTTNSSNTATTTSL